MLPGRATLSLRPRDICAALMSQGVKDRGLIVVPQTHCPFYSSLTRAQVPQKTTKKSKMPFHPLAGILARAYSTLRSWCLSGDVTAGFHTKGYPNGTLFRACELIASTGFEVCLSCSNDIFLVCSPQKCHIRAVRETWPNLVITVLHRSLCLQ